MSDDFKMMWFISTFLTASVLHAYFTHPQTVEEQTQCQIEKVQPVLQESEPTKQPESSSDEDWI